MNDCVSREDVLNIAAQYCPDDDGSCSKADVDLREMLDKIEALPSADVQPVKHGRWKPVLYTSHCSCGKSYQTTFYNCSVCDHVAEWQPYGLNYCPYCGAEMKGESVCY